MNADSGRRWSGKLKQPLLDDASSPSGVGSPARGAAEKDAGTKEVKRGTGVLLTDHMVRKIARMCECYQVEVMYAEDAISKLRQTLERIRNSPRRYSWNYRTRIEQDGDGLKYMIRKVEEYKQRVLRDDKGRQADGGTSGPDGLGTRIGRSGQSVPAERSAPRGVASGLERKGTAESRRGTQ